MTRDELASEIAWEQVRAWQIFMTAAEAGVAVGFARSNGRRWDQIAKRLAKMWLELTEPKILQLRKKFHKHVHRFDKQQHRAA